LSYKLTHIDIETAPNQAFVWGFWKQNISQNQIVDTSRVLCFSAKEHGSKKIQFFSEKKDGQEEMLLQAWDILNQSDAVCHYNGDRFDLPTLNKEFLKLGWTPPAPYKSIDLLRAVKKIARFGMNKLDHVSQELGIGEKGSHEGFLLWVKCMQGDKKAWAIMEKYNKQDVLLLEKLYDRLLPWIPNLPNRSVYDELDVCPKCGSNHLDPRGFSYTQTSKFQRYKCGSCGGWSRSRASEPFKSQLVNSPSV
jgi:DNA polymerase elongation subunit (family B)